MIKVLWNSQVTHAWLTKSGYHQTWIGNVPNPMLIVVMFCCWTFCFPVVKPLMPMLPLWHCDGNYYKNKDLVPLARNVREMKIPLRSPGTKHLQKCLKSQFNNPGQLMDLIYPWIPLQGSPLKEQLCRISVFVWCKLIVNNQGWAQPRDTQIPKGNYNPLPWLLVH